MFRNFFRDNDISEDAVEEAVNSRTLIADPAARMSAFYWSDISRDALVVPLNASTDRRFVSQPAPAETALGMTKNQLHKTLDMQPGIGG